MKLLLLVERHMFIRRVVFIWMIVQTAIVLAWGMDFAAHSARPGMEVAAILAAILTPLSTLQGYCFKMYNAATTRGIEVPQ